MIYGEQSEQSEQEAGRGGGGAVDSSEEELGIFGLSSAETKIIIGLIEQGPTGVSKLSRETGISHTTIHSALRRLRSQGLVNRVSKGYASVWDVVNVDKIRKRLNRALEPLEADVSRENVNKKLEFEPSNVKEFFTFQGVEALLKVYQWFFLNHRNNRVCGIQTTHSAETLYTKIAPELIAQINAVVNDNRVVVDAIMADSVKAFYERHMPQNRYIVRSMESRMASVHIIPDLFMDFNADMIISHDTAFIANWESETLILIKNPDLIKLLKNLFEFLRYAGKLFDQKDFIHKLIEEKRES